MNSNQTRRLMHFIAGKMIASEPELTRLDMAVGDGDHGIGMQRGFTAVDAMLNQLPQTSEDIGGLLTHIGTELMSSMGGASGAIFGTMFRAGGKSVEGETELTSPVLARFLANGLDAVRKRGGAKPGDKTMVDALAAAVAAAQQRVAEPLDQALPRIAEAAMQGANRTEQMVALFGRAKSLGERSLGHPDPGAMSMALILSFMAEGIRQHDIIGS